MDQIAKIKKKLVKTGSQYVLIIPKILMESEVIDPNGDYEFIVKKSSSKKVKNVDYLFRSHDKFNIYKINPFEAIA